MGTTKVFVLMPQATTVVETSSNGLYSYLSKNLISYNHSYCSRGKPVLVVILFNFSLSSNKINGTNGLQGLHNSLTHTMMAGISVGKVDVSDSIRKAQSPYCK
jgi:hypothetical protein